MGKQIINCVTYYPTPNALSTKIDEYFYFLETMQGEGKYTNPKSVPTFSGLARYLGFSSRKAFLDYADEGDGFQDVINDAKLRLEEYLEQRLYTQRDPKGIIFGLKNNAEWFEKAEVKVPEKEDKGFVFTWSSETNPGDIVDAETVENSPPPTGGGVNNSGSIDKDGD